jgi:large subunit ribosomal protein L28
MKCEICGKSVAFGNKVSHSNRKTNRMFKPNIRRVRVLENGTRKTVDVCARCLRSNKVNRVTVTIKQPVNVAAETAVEAVETIEEVSAEAAAEETADTTVSDEQ